jgi:hypothetical protein
VTATVGFDRVQQLVRVPVEVAGDEHRFLVDTGIGVTVVSSAVAARADVDWIGETFSGRRMSGQTVEAPLVRLPTLKLGQYSLNAHVAAVADLGDVDGPDGFAGILGPGFFEHQAVTINPDAMTLTVQPVGSLREDGHEIPLEVRRDGVSFDPFVRLVLPSGREVCVEVDTGSASLILDPRFMPDCGVQLDSPGVTTKTGVDETGYRWTRHWVTISGEVHLVAAPETAQASPRVMFQDIIYDGLIGTDYLDRYRVTFDVSGARLILSPRSATAQ